MDQRPLTPEEIAKLRELLPVAEIVRREAEYQVAWRLVASRGKSIVVWVAGLIAAILIVREAVIRAWQAFIGG